MNSRQSRHASLAGLFLAAWVVLSSRFADGAVVSTPDSLPPSKSSPAIHLFNGTNLAGWRSWLVDTGGADPRRVFSVTARGELRISGDGLGYLGTEALHSNYALVVEFRWGATNTGWGGRWGRARDSGIFLQATGPDGNSEDGRGAFMAAIECQIMEGAIGDLLLIRGTNRQGRLIAPHLTSTVAALPDADGWPRWDPQGRSRTLERWGRLNRLGKARDWGDEFGFLDPGGLEAPAGAMDRWNRLECVCLGDGIEITLNGRRVNAATRVSPNQGRILLQCEGSEIFFRAVELQPLPRPTR